MLRPLPGIVLAALIVPGLASAAKEEKKEKSAPAKAIRVAILPFVNASQEIGATKMMEDVMRDEMKRIEKSRAVFLMPADAERILSQRGHMDKVYRITDRWEKFGTLDSTAVTGLDSVLQVDAILCVAVREWENHRVPVVGAGQSSTTVALSFALYEIGTMARLWMKEPREQRFSEELDASSTAVNYDDTGVIQSRTANDPPRYEAVAGNLVREAFKKFPQK
jgi:hypothetical protein